VVVGPGLPEGLACIQDFGPGGDDADLAEFGRGQLGRSGCRLNGDGIARGCGP
jgi:hypothetical protein